MRRCPRTRLALAISLELVLWTACQSAAATPSWIQKSMDVPTTRGDSTLINQHAPIFFFHDQELNLPSHVELLDGRASLTHRHRQTKVLRWSLPVATRFARRTEMIDESLRSIDSLASESYWTTLHKELNDRQDDLNEVPTSGRAEQKTHAGRRRTLARAIVQVERLLASLRNNRVPHPSEISLDLRGLHLEEFQVDTTETLSRHTPSELALELEEQFKRDPPVNDNWRHPIAYVHLEKGVRLSWPRILKHRRWIPDPNGLRAERAVGRPLSGVYDVIHYMLYHPFNAHSNSHESDWDSSIAVVVPRDPSAEFKFVVYFAHHSALLYEVVNHAVVPGAFTQFLEDYQAWMDERREAGDNDQSVGPCFALDGHPLVFVAQGSHAAYPVPGMTVTGPSIDVDLLGRGIEIKVPFGIDVHSAGRRFFAVGDSVVRADTILTESLQRIFTDGDASILPGPLIHLALPGLRTYEVLRNNPWAYFPGAWGEPVEYVGWSGGHNFLLSHKYIARDDPTRMRSWLERAGSPERDRAIVTHLPARRSIRAYPDSIPAR